MTHHGYFGFDNFLDYLKIFIVTFNFYCITFCFFFINFAFFLACSGVLYEPLGISTTNNDLLTPFLTLILCV